MVVFTSIYVVDALEDVRARVVHVHVRHESMHVKCHLLFRNVNAGVRSQRALRNNAAFAVQDRAVDKDLVAVVNCQVFHFSVFIKCDANL